MNQRCSFSKSMHPSLVLSRNHRELRTRMRTRYSPCMWKSRHTRGGVKRERRRRRNAKRLGEMKVPSVLMVLISQILILCFGTVGTYQGMKGQNGLLILDQ